MNVIVNVDSTTTLSYLKIEALPWNVRSKAKRIEIAMERFNSCAMEYCYIELNALADVVAYLDAIEGLEETDIHNCQMYVL